MSKRGKMVLRITAREKPDWQNAAGGRGISGTIEGANAMRKTGICRLLQNDVHPLHVSQLTGHKNPDSLKHYHVASTNQRNKVSDIINANDHSEASSSSSTASSLPIVKSNQVKRACPENFSTNVAKRQCNTDVAVVPVSSNLVEICLLKTSKT